MDIIYDPVFLEHDTGTHPEGAGRLGMLLGFLGSEGIKLLKPPNGEEFLKLAHTQEYIELVKGLCKGAGSGWAYLDGDTPLSAQSYDAACYAVGGAVKASEVGGFALVRPPGHHAFASRGSGFCIFNNMAIAALKAAGEGKRVFILDIDIHHGNGTQSLVQGREGVKFLSIHQNPLYPGSGLRSEENCVNIPLPPGTGDEEYIKVLDSQVKKELEGFGPDLIGVSVGFDAFGKDVGWVAGNDFRLTAKTYKHLRDMLEPYDWFATLEGGYNPESILEGTRALLRMG